MPPRGPKRDLTRGAGRLPNLPRAMCRGMAPALFTDPDEEASTPEQVRDALAICGACPERITCGTWALDHPGYTRGDGLIWGGLTVRERRLMWAQIDRRGVPA